MGRNNIRKPSAQTLRYRTNRQIRANEVRIVGEGDESVVLPIKEALKEAERKGLDLVEISPNAQPPVCRIVDYSRLLLYLF